MKFLWYFSHFFTRVPKRQDTLEDAEAKLALALALALPLALGATSASTAAAPASASSFRNWPNWNWWIWGYVDDFVQDDFVQVWVEFDLFVIYIYR